MCFKHFQFYPIQFLLCRKLTATNKLSRSGKRSGQAKAWLLAILSQQTRWINHRRGSSPSPSPTRNRGQRDLDAQISDYGNTHGQNQSCERTQGDSHMWENLATPLPSSRLGFQSIKEEERRQQWTSLLVLFYFSLFRHFVSLLLSPLPPQP